MKLYHFIKAKHGIQDIKKKHIKITQIDELNDPFEFSVCYLSDSINQNVLEKAIETVFKNKKGIICFSRNWKNPVQWAHYADNYRGLCLGFDIVNDKDLSEVQYVENRISLDNHLSKNLDDPKLMELMINNFKTKFKHWQYEEEFRLFSPLTNKHCGHYFLIFSDNIKLKEVFIGLRSRIAPKKIKKALGDMASEVEIFETRISNNSFEIEKNPGSGL
ncbi:MAG: DUF2971 domain-containing protein [Candidatus Pacebacteria bacterium]|nr:DUF2971 domain-containing protein [Candidatus Paceibacterota bacterium]MDD5224409.1 DUF2971 domain-containing protein [bacterium]